MNEQSIRWDDLQIVLAIASEGSLSGAGRCLGMSHATVFRRLTDMEQQLGVTLFNRTRKGYTQTIEGEDLAKTAARVQEEVLGAERRIAGRDLALSGTVRVTTTDTLFTGLLSPIIAGFRIRYPQIVIEVAISNQRYSLSRREADIAIRPTRTPPESLVGRRVAEITQAIYGQRCRWQNTVYPLSVAELSTEEWIGPDVHLGDTTLESWMTKEGRKEHCQYRVDTIMGMLVAARQGTGIAVLPCYLGDADDALIRLTTPIPALTTQLWLLTHPDLRRVARIRTFLDEVGEAIRAVMATSLVKTELE